MAGLMVLSALALVFFGLGLPVHAVGWVAVIAALCYLVSITVRPRVPRMPPAPPRKASLPVPQAELPTAR